MGSVMRDVHSHGDILNVTTIRGKNNEQLCYKHGAGTSEAALCNFYNTMCYIQHFQMGRNFMLQPEIIFENLMGCLECNSLDF